MNLLLAQQRIFDEKRFDQPEWQANDWRAQKTWHIGLHMAKAAFKLCQSERAQAIGEVVPDLAIYRAQLVNTHDLSLDMCESITDRVPGESAVLRELARSSGELAYYVEPVEHGDFDEDVRLTRVASSVAHLHIAIESLAQFHGIDAEQAHANRLQELMGS